MGKKYLGIFSVVIEEFNLTIKVPDLGETGRVNVLKCGGGRLI
jgi:hypothetical protein